MATAVLTHKTRLWMDVRKLMQIESWEIIDLKILNQQKIVIMRMKLIQKLDYFTVFDNFTVFDSFPSTSCCLHAK